MQLPGEKKAERFNAILCYQWVFHLVTMVFLWRLKHILEKTREIINLTSSATCWGKLKTETGLLTAALPPNTSDLIIQTFLVPSSPSPSATTRSQCCTNAIDALVIPASVLSHNTPGLLFISRFYLYFSTENSSRFCCFNTYSYCCVFVILNVVMEALFIALLAKYFTFFNLHSPQIHRHSKCLQSKIHSGLILEPLICQ